MSDTDPAGRGGFAGDPADALAVADAGGCCGNAPLTTVTRPVPVTEGPCCGTPAEAKAESSCCGSAAKSTAVAAGRGCCG